jgi:uncharacterized Tic20 family protein
MADHPALLATEIPTKEECTMAFLAHLLQVFTGFIAPLVIFCVKQDSRFVKFHALQSLIWQLCYMALFFGAMMLFFVSMVATIIHSASGGAGHNQPPPLGFFIFFPLVWLFGMAGWVANLILGIVYGIKANRGEWAGYPVIGPWLLRKYHPGIHSASATQSMS